MQTLAAEKLGVPAEKITITSGEASVVGQRDRRVSFAELANGVRIAKTVSQAAVLLSAADFTVMGRSPKRLDGVEKVNGSSNTPPICAFPASFMRASCVRHFMARP